MTYIMLLTLTYTHTPRMVQSIQDHARLPVNLGTQYLIITPHNISYLKTQHDLRIHQMKPPVRGSRGAQQATLEETGMA